MYLDHVFESPQEVAALISSVTALALGVVNYVLTHRLAAWKDEHETELQNLKAAQQAALTDFQVRATERLEALKASLARMERIESDTVRSRGEAYGEIWGLTGSVSLFGPGKPPSASDLSAKLSTWNFTRGWLLTAESKSRYFLIQEVLNYFILHALSFRRPADEILFGSPDRPSQELRRIRAGELGVDPRGDEGHYTLREVQACVSTWKAARVDNGRDATTPEQAWVILQFVMSSFRTHLVEELQSRDVFAAPAPAALSAPPVATSAPTF